MRDNNYKTTIAVIAVICLIIVAGSVLFILTRDDNPPVKPHKTALSPTEAPITKKTEQFTAIITSADPENSILTLWKPGEIVSSEYTYTGATDIRTDYGRIVAASYFKVGDFVDVTADTTGVLSAIATAANVWSYPYVRNLAIDTSLSKMTIGENIYRYDDSLLVLNNGYFVGLNTLSGLDVLTVYGIDNYIYLIEVSSGHGYLKLNHYEDFIGGMLRIGNSRTVEITKDMQVTLAEGEYSIIAQNAPLSGSATILITRDRTSVFDLAPFLPEPVEYGRVRFKIDPFGTDLYIDGVKTDYSSDVSLSYGEHIVEATLGGYSTFTGAIDVERSSMTLNIVLQPVQQNNETPIITASPGGRTDSNEEYDPDFDEGFDDDDDDFGDDFDDDDFDDEDFGDDFDKKSSGDSSKINPDDKIGTDDSKTSDSQSDRSSDNDNPADSGGSDKRHIIIYGTEGAAVFVNDVYKGIIRNGSFITDKVIGTIAIRLTCEGYITDHYTVYVSDDDRDAVFTFPAMEERRK